MSKFWKWAKDEINTDTSELILDGVIASESWWDDEVTPKMFRDELSKHSGAITVRINSPGGDVWAGVSIYNALLEHQGNVTVKIDGIAASIASLIAMAGDDIVMLPGSMMMVHQPWTIAMGNSDEIAQVVEMLEKTCESMIPIYAARTGQSEEKVLELLKAETWMTAEDAVALGFATEAVQAKTSVSDSIKNALAYASNVQSAVMQPVMSMQTRAKAVKAEEVKEAETTSTTTTEDVEVVETPAETPTETDEVVATPVPETNKPTEKEIVAMTDQEKIAASQVLEPKDQANPTAAPAATNYLKTKASIEDFAEVLRANAGKSFSDVKDAWKEVMVKNGLTDADYFRLPEPLVTNIEDAVKTSGIYNLLNHTGLDVFKVVWDDTDAETDTSRAGGHKKGDTKDEQVLDFENRVIRAQYIYKYLVLDKETIRENKSTGALVRFVMQELPTRVIREIERAVVIGDGRATNNKRHIASFASIKSDVVANNTFASTYTPAADETRYESIVKALDMLEAEGPVYLISKKGFTTDLKLQTNSNGGYIFAPGADVASAMGFAGEFKPTWFNDTTDTAFDAYLVVLGEYKTVGDASVESFTNFKLETNEHEYLQEIYKGGALTGLKSAVGIAKPATV